MIHIDSFVVIFVILFLLQICFILLWPSIRMHWQKHIIKLTNEMPGPTHIPVIGAIIKILGTPEQMWQNIRKLSKTYQRIYKVWALNRCSIFIQAPEDLEIFLSSTKNQEKSEAYNHISYWLGTGLLISSGNKWKLRRKLLTPAFHFNILKNFIDAFQKQNDYSVKKITENEIDKETDVVPIVTEYALFSLCDTTMGISIDPQNTEILKYKKAIYDFADYFTERACKPWLYVDFVYFHMTSVGRKCLETIKILQQFTAKILQERLNTWTEDTCQTIECSSGKQKLPMMDLLIKQMKEGADIDYEGIREEVDTFMFEGHDTTSMGMSFLLMLLANNPHIQDKILEEQKHVLGDLKKVANYDDLQNMQYLERCIKESLRMYPPVPMIGRTTDTDVVLENYTIPAGVYVYIMIYDLHHNPKYWPDPEKFDPDRFAPENSANRHPFSYIPFSAGSRNCIGQRFAMLEMKSFVSQIIREFRLEPVDTPETIPIKADLVLRPSKAIQVKFRKRE